MNKEAGTPEGLNKVCRLGKKWETGKSTGNQPTNQPTNQLWVSGWDGTIWTQAGVPALRAEHMRTQRGGEHCAL